MIGKLLPRLPRAEADAKVGLCIGCVESRRVVSAKLSEFWMCERAARDPRFKKYPPLPVRQCMGYAPRSP